MSKVRDIDGNRTSEEKEQRMSCFLYGIISV